ncbi:DUF4760 domain-containing protein [Micromonospora sp. WMMD812]|uniref:DUF4760 domain-containing protein n=1 Tax=Micromonospora sp. WMMD812 TaxID=3015152 RepID=UPI00248AB14A|nr:DUF4760 domain-containing protein [Micromonospora sp. WMMD812]WBB68825.1 DUF4760 domain-containing protein [Micromonospora sp. WMMD812]
MDDVQLINVLTLAFSLVAVIVSTILALRQARLMRHNNLLPVIVDIFTEFRDPAFKEHLHYLQHRLWEEYPPAASGTSDLVGEARQHVVAVGGFFNSVGLLVANNVIDEVVPTSAMGGSILRSWARLSPYIANERQRRNDPNYEMYFEDLARRALDLPPSKLRSRLALRSMPQRWFFEGWEGRQPEEVAALFTSFPTPPERAPSTGGRSSAERTPAPRGDTVRPTTPSGETGAPAE